MEQKYAEKVDKILDLLLQSLEKVGTAATEELPKLVHEYITYFAIEYIPIGAIVTIIVIVPLLFIVGKPCKDEWVKDKCDPDIIVPTTMISFVLLVVLCVCLGKTAIGLKKISQFWYAPKAALIEKLRK